MRWVTYDAGEGPRLGAQVSGKVVDLPRERQAGQAICRAICCRSSRAGKLYGRPPGR